MMKSVIQMGFFVKDLTARDEMNSPEFTPVIGNDQSRLIYESTSHTLLHK